MGGLSTKFFLLAFCVIFITTSNLYAGPMDPAETTSPDSGAGADDGTGGFDGTDGSGKDWGPGFDPDDFDPPTGGTSGGGSSGCDYLSIGFTVSAVNEDDETVTDDQYTPDDIISITVDAGYPGSCDSIEYQWSCSGSIRTARASSPSSDLITDAYETIYTHTLCPSLSDPTDEQTVSFTANSAGTYGLQVEIILYDGGSAALTTTQSTSIKVYTEAQVSDDDGDGLSEADGDCNDSDDSAYPEADEICDGIDNDCDDEVDEDPVDIATWYIDSDSDGYGNADSSTQSCEQPDGYVSDNTDCDDEVATINPSATEVCDDEVDNDCDGTTDSDIPTWYLDYDSDDYGTTDSSTQACDQPAGYVSNSSDCDDTNSAINPATTETADDGIDQDCSGADSTSSSDSGSYATDECLTNYTDACLTDDDGDGFCESNTECSDGSEPGDCDDSTSDTNPEADEICDDGVDNNCDGLTIVTTLTKALSSSNLYASTSYTCVAADADEDVDENGSTAEEEDGAGGGCGCDIFGARRNNSVNSIMFMLMSIPMVLLITFRKLKTFHSPRRQPCNTPRFPKQFYPLLKNQITHTS